MNIEFFGLPGSGKSTVREQLLHEFQTCGSHQYLSTEEAFYRSSLNNIDSFYRRLLALLPGSTGQRITTKLMGRTHMQHDAQSRFLAKHGEALSAFFDSDNYQGMRHDDRSLVIGSFLEVGSLRECIKSVTEEAIVIFEEGLIQKSLMFVDHHHDTKPDSNKVIRYLENIPKSDLSIFIEVNIDDCHQRMLSRKDGLTTRLKTADENKIFLFLQRINDHLHEVSSWLDKHHYPVIHIDNNSDTMTAVSAAYDAIEKSSSLTRTPTIQVDGPCVKIDSIL